MKLSRTAPAAGSRKAERVAKPRRRFGVVMGAGLVASVVMALSMGASLSGYTATITNSSNTAASAALAVAETSGGATCNSYDATATCSQINKYGGTSSPLVPGGSQTTTVKFTNTGTVAVGSATLKAAACNASKRDNVVGATTPSPTVTDASNICSVLTVAVYKAATATGTPIYSGTLAAFGAANAVDLGTLAVGAAQDYTFVVTLPQSATTAVQGQQVSQSLAWTFNQ